MNGDAASDALLALVALATAWRLAVMHPGVALGMGLIGLAAAIGTLVYLGLASLLTPHWIASVVAGCAGLPLISSGVVFPRARVASDAATAAGLAGACASIGLLLVIILRWMPWMQAVATAAALLLAYGALRARRWQYVGAATALVTAFAAVALGWRLSPLNGVQQLHLLMAVALLLVGWGLVSANAMEKPG